MIYLHPQTISIITLKDIINAEPFIPCQLHSLLPHYKPHPSLTRYNTYTHYECVITWLTNKHSVTVSNYHADNKWSKALLCIRFLALSSRKAPSCILIQEQNYASNTNPYKYFSTNSATEPTVSIWPKSPVLLSVPSPLINTDLHPAANPALTSFSPSPTI